MLWEPAYSLVVFCMVFLTRLRPNLAAYTDTDQDTRMHRAPLPLSTTRIATRTLAAARRGRSTAATLC